MNSCEITAAVTAIANLLGESFSPDELALLGAIFTQLGDTLAVKAAFNALCEKNLSPSHNVTLRKED